MIVGKSDSKIELISALPPLSWQSHVGFVVEAEQRHKGVSLEGSIVRAL